MWNLPLCPHAQCGTSHGQVGGTSPWPSRPVASRLSCVPSRSTLSKNNEYAIWGEFGDGERLRVSIQLILPVSPAVPTAVPVTQTARLGVVRGWTLGESWL